MICRNCGENILDNSEQCPHCFVYVNSSKIDDRNVVKCKSILVLDNGAKFNLEYKNEVIVGRATLNWYPHIDLGPYDTGPYISRKHGYFFRENNEFYYVDNSKNGTYINNVKIKPNEKVKLNNKDKIKFANISGEIILNQ